MIRPSPPSHLVVQPPGLGADLEHAHVAGVVHPQGRVGELRGGLEDLRPTLLGDPPLAQLLAFDARLGGDEALGQLRLRHLQREQRHGAAVLERGVLGDVAYERALAHRRAGRHDDQVAGLEAAGDLVEVLEARGSPGQRGSFQRQTVELVELLVQDVLDLAEVFLAVVAGDLEHRLLGLLDEVARRAGVADHALLDFVGALQQPAQQGHLAHDLGVAAGVTGCRHEARQLVHGGGSPDLLQVARLAQTVGHRQHVDGLAGLVEVEHRLVDRPVALAVEVPGTQALLDHERVQGAVREQDRPQHRLLGLEVVGRGQGGRGGA